MNNSPQLVKDLGEQGLLKKLQSFCPREIVGDDGAVIDLERDRRLVVTTDVLVDNVHFSDRTTSAFDVGWRAAAANLSDLAAMGATPVGIVVGLSLPGEVPVAWVENLYEGLQQCLTKYNTSIVGGDICRSTVITVAISAFGQVLPERVIRRDRAQVGDAIVVTGVHGASRAGLELLLHPEIGNNLTNAEREELIAAHQRPQPRLDVIQYLAEIETTRAIAGMDSSDGLADAIVQICRSSGVGATLDRRAIPIPSVLKKLVAKEKLWEWVLYGGEDFELVLCLPPLVAEILIAKLRKNAAIVGKITNNDEIILANNLDGDSPESLNPIEGFQHF